MRRIIFAWACFIFALCLTFPARGQNLNINFLGQHEPPNSGIAFGDVWGEGNIACLGIWTGYSSAYGVGIYDISNPNTPLLRSIYTTATSSQNQFEQGFVRNKIGYFASWSGGGLHIISLTNALISPYTNQFLSKIGSAGGGYDDIHTIFLERNFVYEASHRTANGPVVKVIDVSNPSAPVFVRNITATGTTAARVHQITAVQKGGNTILYTSCWGDGTAGSGQTEIWDVTNIGTQPAVWLGKIVSGTSSHSSWPTPDGNTLVVARETVSGDVRLYDISNPASPVLQAIISTDRMGLPPAVPHNPVVVSNLLYFSWYQHGIQIYDISDRTKPVRLGRYDTYPASITASFQGNWGVFPDLGVNKLLLSDIQTGLYILDASPVLTPTNNYPPLMVTQPTSLTVTQGTTATMPAFVTGSSLKYQWRAGSVTSSGNGTVVPGATNSSLVISNVQTSHSTNYFVIATNLTGAVTSSPAALSVTVPQDLVPTITAHPQPSTVYAEQEATFSVAVSGSAPFSYQWKFNGDNLSGATNNSLTLSNVQPEQVGNYSVSITNAHGSTNSTNALLSIIDSPYLNTIQATPGGRSALISWNSTVAADSQVQYEPADIIIPSPDSWAADGASFGTTSYIDRAPKTNHTMLLTGLTPGTRYSFQIISSTDTNTYLSGVYQFTTAGTNIVDNPAATFTGGWLAATSSVDKFSFDYAFANSAVGSPTASATFRPNLITPGKYDVHTWYPQGANRANNAPYSISYNGGSNNVAVNQQTGGGQWNLIGSNLPFAAGTGGFVRVHNNANPSVVMADAVQFVYVDAQEMPSDTTVPDWWANFYGVVDPLADSDGDDYSNAEEYLLGTSPTNANSHLTLEAQASGGSANITFWPFIGNRTYQLLFKTNLADVSWQTLSPGAITPTPYGHGIFSISTGTVSNGFYRLAVTPVAQGDFSGQIALPKGDAFNAFGEAACGINRIYVKPRR